MSEYLTGQKTNPVHRWVGALSGVLFGLLFPFLGTLLEYIRIFGGSFHIKPQPGQFFAIQAQTPLLWIIDFIPVVMGGMGYLFSSHNLFHSPTDASPARKGLAFLLTIFTILPALPLLFALRVDGAQEQATLDVNTVGTLSIDSVSIYRYARENRMSERTERQRFITAELQAMARTRERLRMSYPVAVGATDRAWMKFSEPLRQTGQVEWTAAEKLMIATNLLAGYIEKQEKGFGKQSAAATLFGLLSLTLILPVGMGLLRHLRLAEGELSSERDFIRAVVDTAGAFVIVFDTEGKIVRFNHACEVATGYLSADVVGRLFWEVLVPPEEQARVQLAFHHSAEGDFPREYETTWTTRDGERLLISWHNTSLRQEGSPEIRFIIGTGIDVTLRRRLESERSQTLEELRASEHRLNEAQEAARIGSWDFDLGTGKIELSLQMFHLLQLDPAQGKPDYARVMQCYHPDDVAMHDATLAKAILDGEGYEFDIRTRRKDGSIRWMHAIGRGIWDPMTNEVIRLTGTLQDITERHEAEAVHIHLAQEAEEARDQALEASRAKSSFLANMSHEIRTPLNGVLGMNGLLLDTGLTEEQRDYTETAIRSGESLLVILNDILDLSKIEAGKLDIERIPFNVRLSVEDVVVLLRGTAESKRLKLISLVYHDVPEIVLGDPGRVRQVLTNLIGNAVKFTEQGRIMVRVKVADQEETSSLLRFEVSDTGIGIPESALAHLFQAFSQVDASTTRRFGGTGLGLAISAQLCELMGGEIGVDSEEGKGSTFWFTIRAGIGTNLIPTEKL